MICNKKNDQNDLKMFEYVFVISIHLEGNNVTLSHTQGLKLIFTQF